MNMFAKEEILLHNFVLNYRTDLYFPGHELAIEVHEKGHSDRKKKMIKDRKSYKINLIVNLLELILIEKIVEFSKKVITLMNQTKN